MKNSTAKWTENIKRKVTHQKDKQTNKQTQKWPLNI